MLRKEQKIAVIFFVLYLVSWVLPVWTAPTTLKDLPGYRCAFIVQMFMFSGMSGIWDMITFKKDFDLLKICSAFSEILIGISNILFIISFFLIFKKRRSSFYLAGPCIVGMLFWLISLRGLQIGYYLWLMSGLGLFLLSAMEYSNQTGVKGIRLFVSKGACIMYVAIGIIILAYIPQIIQKYSINMLTIVGRYNA